MPCSKIGYRKNSVLCKMCFRIVFTKISTYSIGQKPHILVLLQIYRMLHVQWSWKLNSAELPQRRLHKLHTLPRPSYVLHYDEVLILILVLPMREAQFLQLSVLRVLVLPHSLSPSNLLKKLRLPAAPPIFDMLASTCFLRQVRKLLIVSVVADCSTAAYSADAAAWYAGKEAGG